MQKKYNTEKQKMQEAQQDLQDLLPAGLVTIENLARFKKDLDRNFRKVCVL